jgi:hypothetical protein
MKSAKELCALLITRALKDLGEEEEEVVVDYLESIGVEVDLDMKPRDMCIALLEKTMVKELGKKVPMTAYANSLIKPKEVKFVDQEAARLEKRREERNLARLKLEKRANELPGCVFAGSNLVKKTLYDLETDPELGIVGLEDGSSQYTAAIAVSQRLYDAIFSEYENPVIEIVTGKGNRGYSRITAPHSGRDDLILVSPLVAGLLNFRGGKEGGFLKLCISLPEIKKIDFTFYGGEKELNENMKVIIEKVPNLINAFSYLSLGMVLTVDLAAEGSPMKEIQIRVDGLFDEDSRPLFAGIIPFGLGDLPFDIKPDI